MKSNFLDHSAKLLIKQLLRRKSIYVQKWWGFESDDDFVPAVTFGRVLANMQALTPDDPFHERR